MKDDLRSASDQTNEHEQTVVELLSHLSDMRKAVPVNYRLKEDLKRKLMEQMQGQKQPHLTIVRQEEIKHNDQKRINRKRGWYMLGGVGTVALAAFLYVNVAQADVDLAISKSPISIPKLSTDSAVLSSDLQVAYLQADNKLHIISGYDSEIDTPIELPQQIGTYDSIAWNSTNTKLALTENSQDKGKLWVLQLNQSKEKSYAPRLLLEQENRPVIDPAFDPKDEFLAYTVYKQDKPEVWVTNLRTFGKEKVANGSKAAWSHNGRYLSFEQNGEVCIYDRQTGEIKEKVRGSSPSWFSAKQLTILSPDGVMLMGTMDETIKNWKKVKLPAGIQKESVKRAEWTSDGKHLLIVNSDQQGFMFTPLDLQK
ncbi:TolB family protein [Brevibacillus laterosporus]|uniref:TolB family protein n=1 Tax=Brevibacillus laterosporus TaxID=1465 RepID=UPI00037725CD|nr:hypothetical protein [Brevibacillus laterosporus]ATO47696.1 hypothetical protein BrL25_00390 [Brevibacillus laterosporus DSM 25]AYB37712.1 hypothetical protein D5F52_05110 [Brevibacillus laterosporus]MBG9774688.1 hypothetical protein [Brevibacillus laterosporus]MBG9798950.1 hypothetical protein [Brevibacillus laterosporus]MBM7108320.1 Protein TolB [Brevibacillus laterosporus]